MGQILASLKHDLHEARRYLRAHVKGKGHPDPIIPWPGGKPLVSIAHETFEAHAEEVIELYDRLVAVHAPTPPPESLSRLISDLRRRNTPRVESGAVENFDGREWRVVGRPAETAPGWERLLHGAPTAPAPALPLVLTAGCPRCGEPFDASRGVLCGPCERELARRREAA